MGIGLSIAPMRLDHHDVAVRELTATDPCEDIIQARNATAHESPQHDVYVVIEGEA